MKVINAIRLNPDLGEITVLVLLDLSAASDTVDQRMGNCVEHSGVLPGFSCN